MSVPDPGGADAARCLVSSDTEDPRRSTKPDQTKPTPRVAVVAIHGVADQQPGTTAHRISDLLLMHLRHVYTGFIERTVSIGVQAVQPKVGQGEKKKSHRARLKEEFRWDSRSRTFPRASEEARKQTDAQQAIAPAENVQHDYMREQLEEYQPQGEDAVYQTIRLSGACVSQAPATERVLLQEPSKRQEVHIFEMYWADLSRAASAAYRLIMQLYLLLFVLCRLGRYSIQFAKTRFTERSQERWWRRFERSQRWAEGFLVLVFPILALCLLGLVVPILPIQIREAYRELTLNVALAAVALVLTGLLLYWKREWWSKRWPFSLFALVFGSALLWRVFYLASRDWNPLVPLAAMAWLLAACAILWFMHLYQRCKPGASLCSAIAIVLVTTVLFVRMFSVRNGDEHDLLDAMLFVFEGTFVLLALCWLVFGLCYWAVCFTGYIAVKTVKETEVGVARHVGWTAHLTLALPGAVIAITTVAIGQALLIFLGTLIPHDNHYYAPVVLAAWIHPTTLVIFFREALRLVAGPYFTYFYALTLIAGGTFAWSLLPVLQAERRNPKDKEEKPLGRFLDGAYKYARWPGIILCLAVALTPILFVLTLMDPSYEWVWPAWLRDRPGRILAPAGSVFVLIAVGSKWPFKAFNQALHSAVDIALDVTNWLRLNPKKTNPKARISARFVSLLRHLHNWRDPADGSPYAGIVIIAHSQGTVIAAEVLRFIAKEADAGRRDPLLKGLGVDIPIYLFTMGSPLRQLYSVRLPHHYSWAGQDGPDPQSLRVKKWVNVYRSADYVGRHLWPENAAPAPFEDEIREPGKPRCERCIGAGGHNHYWDETAEEVAKTLQTLIEEAARVAPIVPRRADVTMTDTPKVGI